MKASVGDHIIVASPAVDGPVRDGEIVELHNADGSPPYVVRWSDSGHTGLFFPGADAHVSRTHDVEPAVAPAAPHVRSWRVNIDLFESGDDTTAHAVLVAESPERIDASGQAHRNPGDAPVPEIGDEVAVARALRRLSDRLLEVASADISGVQGRPATLQR
jgi:Domain of unknown function (DUF1876)/Domain of unknown function (DUF1918)